MNIHQLIRELNAFKANMPTMAQSALNSEVNSLLVDLQKRSPVDSGAYKGSWRVIQPRFNKGPSLIAGKAIINDDPKSHLMEFGATPGSAPWYFQNKTAKSTGKLALKDGKVWAGGLNPGHGLTIGGAIDPVIFKNDKRQLQIAKAIATRIVKAI